MAKEKPDDPPDDLEEQEEAESLKETLQRLEEKTDWLMSVVESILGYLPGRPKIPPKPK